MAKTPREDKVDRFVAHYLVHLNATQAYKDSHPGVTDSTARTEGSRLLANPNVQEKIRAAKEARSKRTQISQDRVIRELARIAFLDLRKAYDKSGQLLDVPNMPESVARAISAVEVRTEFERDAGDMRREAETVTGFHTSKLKLNSKIRALEILLEHVKTTGDDGKSMAETFADLAAEAEDWEKNGDDKE